MNIIDRDPWLEPYRAVLERREHHYGVNRHEIDQHGGILGPISQGHHYFGFNRGDGGFWYREWAPAATYLSLIGDFNQWDRGANPMSKDEYGVWSLFLPDSEFQDRLTHGSKVKVHVDGQDRIPAYIRRAVQEVDHSFVGQFWNPEPYKFLHNRPRQPDNQGLRIYEAHVGMATEESKVGSYNEFRENLLPRIANHGHNAIQLMAVQEHPYYGSFGYHVSSFFAVSSRCGTPEDLKQLIDEAHGLGLKVFLDIVHSHSVKNTQEGLTGFDGSDHQYFHSGARGLHPVWDSSLFDYTKYEVRRFLLSNVRFWLEEFNFDGFRFDGITSMLYHHHGFSDTKYDTYDPYFDSTVDEDSLLYLKLANEVAHATYPDAVTIAEEVTGMPGLARPVSEMGLGFDYRLAMGIQSTWFSNISKKRDEDWVLDDIFAALLNRRRDEKHIGYVESHDEALVGDKTLAFWLMDKEMYTGMDNLSGNLVVDRGIALHKMIRLMTFSCGGEGYLNFMGNEFGHPEWIDFPNEANGYSHDFARRQWSLADNGFLRYQGLDRFDIAMQALDIHFGIMLEPAIDQLALHEADRHIAFRRGPLVFVFNYNATRSFEEFRLPLPEAEDYVLMLSTDEEQFRGHARVTPMTNFPWLMEPKGNWAQSTNIYLPSRSALVFAPRRLLDQVNNYRDSLV